MFWFLPLKNIFGFVAGEQTASQNLAILACDILLYLSAWEEPALMHGTWNCACWTLLALGCSWKSLQLELLPLTKNCLPDPTAVMGNSYFALSWCSLTASCLQECTSGGRLSLNLAESPLPTFLSFSLSIKLCSSLALRSWLSLQAQSNWCGNRLELWKFFLSFLGGFICSSVGLLMWRA